MYIVIFKIIKGFTVFENHKALYLETNQINYIEVTQFEIIKIS